MNHVSKIVAALGVLIFPCAAQAGTAAAVGTAAFNVVNQCSVTGETVNLGTFTVNDTWNDVASVHGSLKPGYTAGTLGLESLNFGSVTCNSGTPYTMQIKGTATTSSNAMRFTVNGKTMAVFFHIKKLGGVVVPDNTGLVGLGAQVHAGVLSGVGTGSAQSLLGHALFHFTTPATTALATDKLGVSGTYTDTLTYTLNF